LHLVRRSRVTIYWKPESRKNYKTGGDMTTLDTSNWDNKFEVKRTKR